MKTINATAARALARRIEEAAAPGGEISRKLLAVKLRGLSDATTEAYRTDLREYLEYAASAGLAPGDARTLEAFKRHLLTTGLRPTSINRKLTATKRILLEYARKAYGAGQVEVLTGLYRDVRLLKIPDSEKAVSRERMLSEAEAVLLLAGLPLRVRLIAELLLQTGARISEALGIRLSEIKEVNGHSEIPVVGKGGKARTLLVKTELVERIKAEFQGAEHLLETRGGKPFRRSYILREIARASQRELGRHITPHGLRHTFATLTLAKTHKLKGVSMYLGHSDPATTLRAYVHEKLEVEDLLGT